MDSGTSNTSRVAGTTALLQFHTDPSCYDIRFHGTGTGAALTLHANGTLTWTGDQSDAVKAFWDAVDAINPRRAPRPNEVRPGDWIQFTGQWHDDEVLAIDVVSPPSEHAPTVPSMLHGAAGVWTGLHGFVPLANIVEVRRGIAK